MAQVYEVLGESKDCKMAIKDDYQLLRRRACALITHTAIALILAFPCRAENAQSEMRARLAEQSSSGSLTSIRYSPVTLEGGAKLTIVTPERWSDVSMRVSDGIVRMHRRYTALLGEIPAFSSAVRLMDEDTFYLTTGAPRWTNAMYFRGEIIIPLSLRGAVDLSAVERSLRHEYTHAVINSISKGRCPGWLDEGMAQWAEGQENPALRPALYEWLGYNSPLELRLLQGGFTRLDPDMVAAAYAQSLFAANTMINTFGFTPISSYFSKLRDNVERREAFRQAFNLSVGDFEGRLNDALVSWRKEYHPQ